MPQFFAEPETASEDLAIEAIAPEPAILEAELPEEAALPESIPEPELPVEAEAPPAPAAIELREPTAEVPPAPEPLAAAEPEAPTSIPEPEAVVEPEGIIEPGPPQLVEPVELAVEPEAPVSIPEPEAVVESKAIVEAEATVEPEPPQAAEPVQAVADGAPGGVSAHESTPAPAASSVQLEEAAMMDAPAPTTGLSPSAEEEPAVEEFELPEPVPALEPIVEQAVEPVVEPANEPADELVTEPVLEEAAEPMAELAAEPTEPIAEPVATPIEASEDEVVPAPMEYNDTIPEAVAEAVAEPIDEAVADHIAETVEPSAEGVETTAVAAESAPDEAAAPDSTQVQEPALVATTGSEPVPSPEAAPEPEAAPAATPEPHTKPFIKLETRDKESDLSPFSVVVSQVYDGPLDLLLDLIRKQDIDVYDIPIARITAQFLAYVNQLKATDVDVAGEFIYTASLLIHIKSKMLLPRAPTGQDDAAEDPRRELVERLLEHERFKNAAQMLQQKQMLEAATWTNPGLREFKDDEAAEPEIAADTVDLVRIFRDILERARTRPVINVEEDSVTVGQMIQFLSRRLTMEDKPVALRRLLSHTKSERALIAMFLALLELVRLQAILLRQDLAFSEIFIKKNTAFDAVMNDGINNARDDWR